VLGRHPQDKKVVVRAHLPYAKRLHIAEGNLPLERIPNTDLFEWHGKPEPGSRTLPADLARFRPSRTYFSRSLLLPAATPDFDLYLFGEGKHWHAYRFLGAHRTVADGVAGVLFAVWAPSAERVSVVGNFNRWDGRMPSDAGARAAAASGSCSSPTCVPAISTSLKSAIATAARSC
jgi:1,4-alpha-glucan branching enzyme